MMSSELGRGSLRRATALRSLVIALGTSENKVGMAERCLPRLFGAGGVGNWTKSMMLSLGDGSRMLEMAGGIPAIAVCNVLLATARAVRSGPVRFFRYFLMDREPDRS